MTTTTTSRRAILAGLAAAPALSASAPALANTSADAELIGLGLVHADLRAKYEIARDLSDPRDAAWSAALDELNERFGNAHISDDEYKRIGAQLDRDFPAPKPSWEDACDMMCPIEKKIMALPALTFAGLAVKARVAKSACDTYWNEPADNCNWDELMARQLIEAVLAFARGAVS